MKNLFEQFLCIHPEFDNSLKKLPKEIKSKFIGKLKTSTKETNFLSIISEIKFGLMFYNLGFEIKYELKYSNKTPDLTISTDKNKTICEIYRLCQSIEDRSYYDFEIELFNSINKLNFNYLIEFNYCNHDSRLDNYNIEDIINKLELWLTKSKPSIGDYIVINNFIVFSILKLTNSINLLGGFRIIDYKPEKLIQFGHLKYNNSITEKINKYKQLVTKNNIPYFLGIYIELESGFNCEDFVEYFLGQECQFISKDTFSNKTSEVNFGDRTKLGIFYSNIHLSGLILFYNNSFKLLLNPRKSQEIYKPENINILNLLKKDLEIINPQIK